MQLGLPLGSALVVFLSCGGDPVPSSYLSDRGTVAADGLGMDTRDGDGAGAGNQDGGGDGDTQTVITAQNEDLVCRVNTTIDFQGRVMGGVPSAVYWDTNSAGSMMDRDVEGSNVAGDRYRGTFASGYSVPGKYMHTMWALDSRDNEVNGGTNLAKVLDSNVDVMGESLDEAYGKQPERAAGTVFDVWQGLVQADARYSDLSAPARSAIADYETNLARPFGTKLMGQVRIAVFGDRGVVLYQLDNPDIYQGMDTVFEGVEISRDDAFRLQEIMDSV